MTKLTRNGYTARVMGHLLPEFRQADDDTRYTMYARAIAELCRTLPIRQLETFIELRELEAERDNNSA